MYIYNYLYIYTYLVYARCNMVFKCICNRVFMWQLCIVTWYLPGVDFSLWHASY